MTPQGKNFITRIQLQQLVTATGNPNEHGTDSGLSEDFYYQVHNQIRVALVSILANRSATSLRHIYSRQVAGTGI